MYICGMSPRTNTPICSMNTGSSCHPHLPTQKHKPWISLHLAVIKPPLDGRYYFLLSCWEAPVPRAFLPGTLTTPAREWGYLPYSPMLSSSCSRAVLFIEITNPAKNIKPVSRILLLASLVCPLQVCYLLCYKKDMNTIVLQRLWDMKSSCREADHNREAISR